jgi:propanol-preferring alcohol dehydrogenase
MVFMKALQLVEFGQDAEYREVPQPEPRAGEVLVRVGGAGACHSDLHLMHDFGPGMLPFEAPFTLGHENAGWVEGVGPGVTGVEVGEPVAVYGPWGCGRCARCLTGAENYCERAADLRVAGGGLGLDGGMAPFMLVPSSRWLIPIGDLDPVLAAPLTDAALTPYHAVKRSLGLLTPGSTAVVVGAGGLGHMALQILRAMTPATVVAVDQRQDALDRAASLGAHHTVRIDDDPAGAIRDISRGRGVDVVIDLVGVDATLALGSAVLRSLGHLTIVGIGGGSVPVTFFSPAYEVSVATTYWGTLPELVEVVELARAGLIHAEVSRYGLEQAATAYEDLRAGKVEGRAVVVPDLAQPVRG